MEEHEVRCPDGLLCKIGVFEYSSGEWHAQVHCAVGDGPGEPFVAESKDSALEKARQWVVENICKD